MVDVTGRATVDGVELTTTASITIVQANPTIVVSVTDEGDGVATLNWTVSGNTAGVTGVHQGRDGTSSTGSGPWESSSATAGLTGTRVFTNLVNGATYNLYVIPVIDGVKRTDLKTSAVAKPKLPGPSLPTYPGYVLKKNFNLTVDEGWVHWQGKEHISAGYCHKNNTEFGPNGLIIHQKRRATPITSGGYSLIADTADIKAQAGDMILPNYFRGRMVTNTTHFHVGLFPGWWFRPYPEQTGGDGEIDWLESFGGHIGTNMLMHKVTMISTPYGSGQQNYTIPFDFTDVGDDAKDGILNLHTYEIEKAPNSIKTWCDGVLMSHHVPGGSTTYGSMTVANWNRCFEQPNQKWYFRLSGQIGDDPDGQPLGNAGPIPNYWQWTDINLKELAFWVPS